MRAVMMKLMLLSACAILMILPLASASVAAKRQGLIEAAPASSTASVTTILLTETVIPEPESAAPLDPAENGITSSYSSAQTTAIHSTIINSSAETVVFEPAASFTTSSSAVLSSVATSITSAAAAVFSTKSAPPVICSHDNCLRSFLQASDAAFSFCVGLTAGHGSLSTALPGFAMPCLNEENYNRISSACLCLSQIPPKTLVPTPSTSNMAITTIMSYPTDNTPGANGDSPFSSANSTITLWQTTTEGHTITVHNSPSSSRLPSSSSFSSAEQSPTSLTGSSSVFTTSSASTVFSKETSSYTYESPHRSSLSLSAILAAGDILANTTTKSSSLNVLPTSRNLSTIISNFSASPYPTLASSLTSNLTYTTTATTAQINATLASSTRTWPVPLSTTCTAVGSGIPSVWATLPPSDEMQYCAWSNNCSMARYIFNKCMAIEDNTMSWNCFCEDNLNMWNSTVHGCASCVTDALPPDPAYAGATTSLFEGFLNISINGFCESRSNVDSAKNVLMLLGQQLSAPWELPIFFFNMTLVEKPYNASGPVYVSPMSYSSGSPTPTPTPPSTSTPISLRSLTSSLSAHVSIPSLTANFSHAIGWATLPPSDAMIACSESDSCQKAAQLFDGCVKDLSDNMTLSTHDCLCVRNLAGWNLTISSCTNCIANALPQTAQGSNLPSSELLKFVSLAITDFCANDRASSTQLVEVGQAITTNYQSPIVFFNMTLVKPQFPFGGRSTTPALLPLTVAHSSSSSPSGTMKDSPISSSTTFHVPIRTLITLTHSSSLSSTSTIANPSLPGRHF